MVGTIKFSEFASGGNLTNSDLTVGLQSGDNVRFNNPWTFLPEGSTADRPTIDASIYNRLRFNTDLLAYEYYGPTASAWIQLDTNVLPSFPLSLANGGTASALMAVPNGVVYCGAIGFGITAALADAILVTDSGSLPFLSQTLPVAVQENITTLGELSGLTFSPTTAGITGTTTNDNAATGIVGEYMSSVDTVGTVITAGTPITVRFLSLSAGDWDVSGTMATASGNVSNAIICGVSRTTNAYPSPSIGTLNSIVINSNSLGSGSVTLSSPVVRITLAAPATIYLVAQVNNGGGNPTVFSFMQARRAR